MAQLSKRLIENGHLRQLKKCAQTLPEEARAVYDRGKAETQEEYNHLAPHLKLVKSFRQEIHNTGRLYNGPGKKERERAIKRSQSERSQEHSGTESGRLSGSSGAGTDD